MKEFRFDENKVMGITGLSGERLARLREDVLCKGTDWTRDKFGIHYSQTGIDRLIAQLGSMASTTLTEATLTRPEVSVEGLTLKDGAQGQPATAATEKKTGADLKVFFVHPNPVWVQCKGSAGESVRCRVLDRLSIYMRPGVLLRGCVKQQDGTYRYEGR